MNMEEKYNKMMSEIHISEETLGKVMDMNMDNKKNRKNVLVKKMLAAAAAIALCFIVSNGICYAAIGKTWVSKVTMYVNGEAKELDVKFCQEGDEISGVIEMETDTEDTRVVAVFTTDGNGNPVPSDASLEDAEMLDEPARVVTEGDKVYLELGTLRYDITEGIVNGIAAGEVTYDGMDYHYEVTGDDDGYDVTLSASLNVEE